jgi:WD40 repeat protein
MPLHPWLRPRRFLTLLALVAFVLLLASTASPGQPETQPVRQPPPDKAAIEKKEKILNKTFKDELAKAKTDSQAARDLADYLLGQARETNEDPPLRYIALIYARDLAAQGGDTATALAAIEELAKHFTVDTLPMKAATLTVASQKATAKDDHIAIVEQSLALAEEALAQDSYAVAQELVKAAEESATRSKVLQLVARVEKAGADVEHAKKEFGRMQKYIDILAKDPKDAEANKQMGRYFCLVKGNWERGLPMLVAGNDKDFIELAKRDLAGPKDTGAQLDLGDEYATLAEAEKGLTQRMLLKRAYHWYVRCLPNLAGGLNKVRVEKAVEEIGKLFPNTPVSIVVGNTRIDSLYKTFERAHAQGIQVLAVSPDNKYVLSGGIQEQTVRLWDLQTGNQLRQLNGHKEEIWGVAFSPDGKTCASASTDKTMRTWNIANGDPIRTFEGHTDWVRGVWFFPDKKRILTVSDDYTLRIWDLGNGKELKRMSGHTNFVNSLSVSRDGKRAVTGSVDKTVRIWDLEKAQEISHYEHKEEVWAVAISPDGKRAVSASTDNVVLMWDLDKKQSIRALEHPTRVWSIAFAPNGKVVATGTGGIVNVVPQAKIEGGWPQQGQNDTSLYFWEADSGKPLRRLMGHTGYVRALAWSPDGRFLVSGGDDNQIRVWTEGKK